MVNNSSYIRLQAVRAGYKKAGLELAVLDQVHLDFELGQLTALIGVNGGGKSTLLRSIAGLQPVLNGDIFLASQAISDLDKKDLAKSMAVVLTERISGFNLTARDVVSAGQMPYSGLWNRLSKEQLDIVFSAAQRCGVDPFFDLPLHELSDGMFQKTMIAKALAQQTKALLLDEPTAYLDYASKHQLFLLLKELAEKDDKCIIVSTHDLELVMKYCKRMVLIYNGTAKMIGTDAAGTDADFLQITGGYL